MRIPDLSLAVRNIFRRPGFALVAIALLALGAGANAAVFSVVRGVLLRPLPYPAPDRLVAVWPGEFVSNQEIAYWREHTRSFDEIAAQAPGWMMGLVADGGEPLKVTGARVSDNLFKTLGATAALGRTVEPGDTVPGRNRIVVLSDGLWRRRFAADPAVIGRSIQLDQDTLTVVGVMAALVRSLRAGHRPVGAARLGTRHLVFPDHVLTERGPAGAGRHHRGRDARTAESGTRPAA